VSSNLATPTRYLQHFAVGLWAVLLTRSVAFLGRETLLIGVIHDLSGNGSASSPRKLRSKLPYTFQWRPGDPLAVNIVHIRKLPAPGGDFGRDIFTVETPRNQAGHPISVI